MRLHRHRSRARGGRAFQTLLALVMLLASVGAPSRMAVMAQAGVESAVVSASAESHPCCEDCEDRQADPGGCEPSAFCMAMCGQLPVRLAPPPQLLPPAGPDAPFPAAFALPSGPERVPPDRPPRLA